MCVCGSCVCVVPVCLCVGMIVIFHFIVPVFVFSCLFIIMNMQMHMGMRALMCMHYLSVPVFMCMSVDVLVVMLQRDGISYHNHRADCHNSGCRK